VELSRWQFELTWSLLEYHLDRLVDDDLHWEPAGLVWAVRPGPDACWVPDFAETEPDPIPVPTIAWLTWHLGWWWGTALAHVTGTDVPERTEVAWPGDRDGAVAWLRDLRRDWLTALDRLTEADLAAPAPFPWPSESGYTVAHLLGWVDAELMKNTAEIGQLRLLRHALGEVGARG
jgi:hypothetical protein